jgi:hypothetical protein
VSQSDESVIPGEPNDYGQDPESRKAAEIQNILDPGSHPASVFADASPDRLRDLAGMTDCDMVSDKWISLPKRARSSTREENLRKYHPSPLCGMDSANDQKAEQMAGVLMGCRPDNLIFLEFYVEGVAADSQTAGCQFFVPTGFLQGLLE